MGNFGLPAVLDGLVCCCCAAYSRQIWKIRAKTLTNKGKACYYRRFSGFTFAMNAFVIDTFEFSRLKERREGDLAVADFARLCEELADSSGRIRFAVQGGIDTMGHAQLLVSVEADVKLMCQRCLTPFAFAVASESALLLAKDEEAADALESSLADDTIEVMVGSKTQNLLELVEDEVLLSIPLSPKHEVCPDQVGQDAAGAVSKRVSPFEVLNNKQ